LNEIATYLSSFERKALQELEDEVRKFSDQIEKECKNDT
jgi:hypothetical protein